MVIMKPAVMSGRLHPLKYANKLLKKETIKQIRNTQKLNRFGMKILDNLAQNDPVMIMDLVRQGGSNAIITKVLEEQRKWMAWIGVQ